MECGAGREGTGGLALGELFAEAFRLVLVGGGEDDVVPAGEGFAGQGTGVVFPGVLEGLGEEEGRKGERCFTIVYHDITFILYLLALLFQDRILYLSPKSR